MIELNKDGYITIDKDKRKKVRCTEIDCKILNRKLIVHEDIDNKNLTNISDLKTGYKFLSINKKPSEINIQELKEPLEKFIKHFTKEEIIKKLTRIEESQKR